MNTKDGVILSAAAIELSLVLDKAGLLGEVDQAQGRELKEWDYFWYGKITRTAAGGSGKPESKEADAKTAEEEDPGSRAVRLVTMAVDKLEKKVQIYNKIIEEKKENEVAMLHAAIKLAECMQLLTEFEEIARKWIREEQMQIDEVKGYRTQGKKCYGRHELS